MVIFFKEKKRRERFFKILIIELRNQAVIKILIFVQTAIQMFKKKLISLKKYINKKLKKKLYEN